MKKITTFLTLTILILSACSDSNKGFKSQSSIHPNNLLSLTDAEKILGEPAHLFESINKIKGENPKYIDSVSTEKRDASTYSSGYMANAKDDKTGKTGIVYFGFEQYPNESSAKKVYSYYKRTNVNAIGFKELHDIGDEAWFGSSPLFVYVRKRDKIFIMKVNKMTSKTSLVQFDLITKQISDTL